MIARPAGKKVEDMLARSMAWHYLKQFKLERPKVSIVRAADSATKIDVQKMGEQRSISRRPKVILKSSRQLNVA